MPETRETFELLKNYVEELPVGLLLFDPKGKLISWNKCAIGFLEANEEDFKQSDLGLLERQLRDILDGQMTEKELIGLHKPYKIKKIITHDKNILLVIVESFQEAIGEMSHELRRPITNIKTLTESLILGAKNEPEIASKFLSEINNEVDRLTRLVSDILSLSKIRSGKLSQTKKKLNLKTHIDEAIKLLQNQADKNKIKVTNEIPDSYEIFADPEQIDHLIQNLIENAVKYSQDSQEGKEVTIKPGPVQGSFEVIDNGIGISENEISKIFERFYRVDRTRAKGSSGLGLSIVKNVIDLHGGKIEVKSTLGKGSIFTIILPID